jgi:hypothetical protein
MEDGSARLFPTRRPLTAAEQQRIRDRLHEVETASRRVRQAALPIVAVVILILWLWTLLASDAPRPVITGFWLVVGVVIALWVRRDLGRNADQLTELAEDLSSALRRDAAEVYDIRARSYAELEEIEDEGAGYAFELPDGNLVFIVGQEFYPDAGFPSLDFSLVYALNEHDAPVEMLIDRRGAKTAPARIIPAAVKRTLAQPEHLAVYPGLLSDVEAILGPAVG